ncbi:MAG: UbiA family prenyltransferase [Candidatus Eisenbacteria bacterium]
MTGERKGLGERRPVRGPAVWIRGMESAPFGPAAGACAFLVLVYLRNLSESVFENSRFIGFTADGGASSLMIFDHFLLFYGALYVVLALAISAATEFELGRVLRVLLFGWVLILIPPLADALLGGGRGFTITYIPEFTGRAFSFFDPRAMLPEVSPGQRIEVGLGFLLVLAYGLFGGARLVRSVLAAVIFYMVVVFFGYLPVLVAKIPLPGGLPAGDPLAVFRGGGIILHESRKQALLFLLVLVAGGTVLLAKLRPREARAVLRHLRPLRTAHYGGLALLGAVYGAVLFGPYLPGPALGHAYDLLGLGGIVLAVAFAFQCGAALNDLADVRGDRVSAPGRPLMKGDLGERETACLALLHGAAALFLAFNVGYVPFLLVLFALALSAVYSLPPFRLKRIPFVATGVLGLVSASSFLAGFSLFAGGRAYALAPGGILSAIVAGMALAFTAKDLKDVEGDRADGVHTLPTLLGEKRGRRAVAFLVAAGFLAPALFLRSPGIVAAGLPFAAAGALLTLRIRKPDRALLLLYFPFAALVFALVVRDADRYRKPGHEAWGEARAGVQRLLGGDGAGAARSFAAASFARPAGAAEPFPLERGFALAMSGRREEAVPFLRDAVSRSPDETKGWTALADVLYRSGDREGAKDALRRLVADRTDLREGTRRLAGIALEAGDREEARRQVAAEFVFGVFEEEAWEHAGDLALLDGDPPLAARRYGRALAANPRSPGAWAGLGRALHGSGDLDGAWQAFDRALALDPENGVIANNGGVTLRDRGDGEGALRLFDRALALEPGLLDASMNRAGVLERLGRREEAASEYRKILESHPDHAPARARLRVLSGDPGGRIAASPGPK